MRTLKRAGASLLAMGVVAAGMVMTAPIASAHRAQLTVLSTCQTDGTYKLTYSGTTSNVPVNVTAQLTVSNVLPADSTISGAPAPVARNANYGFTQIVPGTATSASATANLVWSDNAKPAHVTKTITLDGNCGLPAPPVCAGQINSNQLSAHYTTDDFHATVSYTGQQLCDNVSRVVSLNSYQAEGSTWPTSGTQTFVDHDQVTIDATHTTGNLSVDAPSCYYQTDLYLGSQKFDGHDGALPHYPNSVVPTDLIAAGNGGSGCVQPKAPSGDLSTSCVNGGGHVVAVSLDSGTASSVTWRLVSGNDASHTTVVGTQDQNGKLEANGLADATKVWLQYDVGQGYVDEGAVVTTGSCAPPVVVAPTGSFTVVCTAAGANVTIGALSSGTRSDVVWTLTYGSASKTVSSGDVVAVPALAALALKYTVGGGDSNTAQTDTAPAACAPTGTVDKTSQPVSGSVVSPGQTVTYTVTVKNTGTVKIVGTPAVDTLPDHVSLVAGSITGGGTASADGRSITWSVTLDAADSATYTYQVTVDADAPARASLLNRVVFLQDEATTTHEVGDRSLAVVKSVSATDALFDETLTYTLIVTAGGNLGQTNVAVSDYIPGYKPGRDSGKATYVPGSAICDAGTCTAAYDDAAKLVTWSLGSMAPGTSRTVTFQVTIDTPAETADGGIPAVTIFNSAAVGSTETPTTPSNEVVTAATAVLGVKVGNKPPHHNQPPVVSATVLPHTGASTVLPHTGASGQLPWTFGAAVVFLLLGTSMIMVARKPEVVRAR